jgi:2-dehydro-3-deoxyglucarate aldolase/4-hydroxy-2-oxoheptanedioate aldolase
VGPELRQRLAAGETLVGTFLNLGSPLAAEICGLAGFDWALVDLEHGAGTEAELIPTLQALRHTGAAALVRVEANERPRFARALDAGAAGVMVPRVDGADEARAAVASMRHPPDGVRGVAHMNRGAGWRLGGADDADPLCVIQVESEPAVREAAAIAAVDGVDVLFVGPSDLSHAMGIPGRLEHERFRAAVADVVAAARGAGKAAGILLRSGSGLEQALDEGFRFVGIGSDSLFLAEGARAAAAR